MNRASLFRVTGLLVFLGVAVVGTSAQNVASVDVPKLIRLAQQHGEAMSMRVFEFSWKSKTLVRNYKKSRLLKELEQDHEVYPAPGLTYVAQKLVKENGLLLSASRAAKEQKRFDRELMEAELESALFQMGTHSVDANGCPTFGIWTVLNGPGGKETSLGISDFLCLATFYSPRAERRDGRDTVVLLFRPREGAKVAPEKTPFAKLIGAIWIDWEDKVVSHIEAWPADTPRPSQTALPATPASIVFDDMRMPDGMWVRKSRYVDTRKDQLAFNGLNLEWKQEFNGYQRYFAETKDYKVSEPESPPKQ